MLARALLQQCLFARLQVKPPEYGAEAEWEEVTSSAAASLGAVSSPPLAGGGHGWGRRADPGAAWLRPVGLCGWYGKGTALPADSYRR